MGAGTSPADGAAEAEADAPAEGDAAFGVAGGDGPAPARSASGATVAGDGEDAPAEPEAESGPTGSGESADAPGGATAAPDTAAPAGTRRSRRFSLTRDTARPEGGGRAAGSDAPAPARQWPLLAVLCTAGAGLLIVAANPFDEAFRVGTILIGLALVTGAALRVAVRSVGMLAVRSRFTDLVTYGLLGTLIVLLALVAQPKPWLDIPFLEDAVHFTVR
ncbi:DUF3017 domain-containing protein [Streptomyces sp. NPDC047803]|uniref:DUF3017 domain-containing protein n=1 Tax=Streptomyces sp. NPDC047803 TaxID=3160976 RepID=UPI0033F6DB48